MAFAHKSEFLAQNNVPVGNCIEFGEASMISRILFSYTECFGCQHSGPIWKVSKFCTFSSLMIIIISDREFCRA